MTLLVRARELIGRPVVTHAGEDVAQVKDVVFDPSSGRVAGFTLNGRGRFAGPLKQALPIAAAAVGPDAVMIADAGVFTDRSEVVRAADLRDGNVLGNRVMTDTGTDLGQVLDVIVQVDAADTDVVGYEVQTDAAGETGGQTALIPLPDALAVSGEALLVPAGAVEFISHDLAGFGAAVTAFRAHLEGDPDAVQ